VAHKTGLETIAKPLVKSGYGQYLLNLIQQEKELLKFK